MLPYSIVNQLAEWVARGYAAQEALKLLSEDTNMTHQIHATQKNKGFTAQFNTVVEKAKKENDITILAQFLKATVKTKDIPMPAAPPFADARNGLANAAHKEAAPDSLGWAMLKAQAENKKKWGLR